MRPPSREELEALVKAPFLLATDFDGTLAPIVRTPDLAGIPEATRHALSGLQERAGVHLAILSGRSLADLRRFVPLTGAILAGNHGLEIAGGGIDYLHEAAASRRPLLDAASDALAASLASWPEAWVERKGLTATVHFRNVPESHRQPVVRAVRRTVAPFGTSLGLRAGKCSLELHPRIGWHKGEAVRLILRHLGLPHSACLCLGDDTTDEHMFRCLPEAITIRVGRPARSAARFLLPDTAAVGETLSWLVERLSDTLAPAAAGQEA